jgi:D-glycero-D-manno-heptose 1,7-bisphosphate phosphatase
VSAGRRRPAVFLDRDGVLNDPVADPVDGRPESPLRADDVVLAPGAVAGCRALRERGFLLLLASNQPAAAKGKATLRDLEAVHERVLGLLADGGVALDGWRYCFHHPAATEPALLGDPCGCRKPAPGMVLALAEAHDVDLDASFLVGDTDADLGAGAAAGVRTVLVAHPGSEHRRGRVADVPEPWARAADLAAAALLIGSPLVAG